MNAIVEQALALWGVPNAEYSLIAARENAVFRVIEDNKPFALRLHRKGYRTDQELTSELQWMGFVSKNGIKVPQPIAALHEDYLVTLNGIQIDALSWLAGEPLSGVFPSLSTQQRSSVFRKIGAEMAKLHNVSDTWLPPQDFKRCAWDRTGLLGDAPLWDRFWKNPFLADEDKALFVKFRLKANDVLSECEGALDYGLIHADLVAANVLLDGEDVRFIDFDDGGFGFRLFDLATTLLKFMDDPDFSLLNEALISGYTSVRTINLEHLGLFLALRSMTYVGWNISRIDEANGRERNERFINTARTLSQGYLKALG